MSQILGSHQETLATGKTGKSKIRFRVNTELDSDALNLSNRLEWIFEGSAKVVEKLVASNQQSFFVIEIDEELEERLELLLEISSVVKSWHVKKGN